MPRRRLHSASLCLLFAILLGGIVWWDYSALSAGERRLLGNWAAPDPNPMAGYITAKGPVVNPWRIWQFRRNRSFRVWIVSADDPGVSILDKEGRWYVEGSKLHLEGFGTWGDAVREAREHVRVKLGGSYVGRTSGSVEHDIRFLDPDTWELTTAGGESITWEHRP